MEDLTLIQILACASLAGASIAILGSAFYDVYLRPSHKSVLQ